MKHRLVLIFGIVCVVAFGVYTVSRLSGASNSVLINQQKTTTITTPNPTPFLFQEMTIPYLRRQTFTSNMTQLDKIEEYPTYTSFRASYLSDGLTIYGLLTVPKGDAPSGKWPAIIFLHGYIPPTVYTTTGQYVAYIDYLARSGFVVFKPDYRGNDRSQGEAGGAYYSGDYLVDTLNAYDAVSKLSYVNPNGIGLWGHSMSGNVSMRVFAARPTIPAVVIWAGAVYTYADMQEYRITDGSYRPPAQAVQRNLKRQKLRDTYGDFSVDSPFWKQVAVTDYLNDLKGSIQIHHAVNDDVVNIGYSRNLMKLLDGTAVSHELYEYPDGGHNISGSSFGVAMERTVKFFKEHLEK